MLTLHFISIAVYLYLLVAVPALPAGDAPPADPQQRGASPQAEADRHAATKPESRPAAADRGSDTFVPSEKVSEDLPVAFPVDI